MTAVRIEVAVVIEVDLDEYAETYGIEADRAEADAAEYLERIVSSAVQEHVGPYTALTWGTFDFGSARGLGEVL